MERTFFAWLSLSRRLSKDHERLPETGEAMIYGAMSRLMLGRLAKGEVRSLLLSSYQIRLNSAALRAAVALVLTRSMAF